MIERAYKKLALDALVIQQGRLAEQKTVNKDELLQMVRFGAEMVFSSKDSTITDEDIDRIIAKGEEATAELDAKMKKFAEDAIKFKMDDTVNKDELLQMVRFGAEMVFSSKDSTITDEDIDRIIAKGEEATAELDAKMKKFAKDAIKFKMDDTADLYDFDDEKVALIVFLSHIGSFVPADVATVGLTDRIPKNRIFCAMGSKFMNAEQSTFVIDLHQVGMMLRYSPAANYSGQQTRTSADAVEQYAQMGLRTLCLAWRELEEDEYREWSSLFKEANSTLVDREPGVAEVCQRLEHDFEILGIAAIEDRLQASIFVGTP
ncbi:ISWI chromatin-remodeling complex ATPase CHR11 [Camellia lanceoleosa]|uniref:ISWI chromatin-remodeling complex ATPase CHR11 n=1 Tax=Camellia lanceoleosa TaxID=1840588 RepID=A0ACC0H4N7_9ERIC|nr:ISWI chromatin-remodeling complex ATPase CHR11 [Camellia lanceoleosa]